MDQELLDLLARLNADNNANPLSDDELADLNSRVAAIAADIDPGNATDDDIAVLTEARDAIVAIRAEQDTRAEAAAQRAEAAAALLAEITPAVDDHEHEDHPAEGDEPVEVVTPDNRPTEGGPEIPAEVPTETHAETCEPIAADAAPVEQPRRLPSISHLAHRRPQRNRPQPTATETVTTKREPSITAAGGLPGIGPSSRVNLEQWAQAVGRKWVSVRQNDVARGTVETIPLGSINYLDQYPADRVLGDNETVNERRIDAVAGTDALTASGGICAPVAVDYMLTTIAAADRPVRDSLPQFGAARGGVRFVLPHTLAAVTNDGPATLWTSTNDANPSSPATKPHATYTCQGVQEVLVDAVTSIVQFGNFQARFFPEQIEQYMATVEAVHARLAEATLLNNIASSSTATTGEAWTLSGTRDFLAAVDRAAAAYRYRHRMAPESPLRLVYPEWLEDLFRTDLARQLPGDSGGRSERLAVADAEIDNFFAVRNINVTNTLDSPTGASVNQGWGVQGAGPLLPWPQKTIAWLFHEGAFVFLDGGTLDLGIVRDSTLNGTNSFQMFMESFEKAVFRGHEALQLTLELCPNGATAATVSTTGLCPPAGSGS